MLYRFSIVFLIGLCLVACSSGSMQEESVPVIRFKPDEEGVQKVFGTLDLFVSLLETEIKYPILQGGILPFWTPSSIILSLRVSATLTTSLLPLFHAFFFVGLVGFILLFG